MKNQSKISLRISEKDLNLVKEIVRKAEEINVELERTAFTHPERMSYELDIIATHANGCPLDFKKWLAFDDHNFSFWHDFCGIINCIDRNTGKLKNNFLPRCNGTTSQKYRIYLQGVETEDCKDRIELLEQDDIESFAEELIESFYEGNRDYPPHKNWVVFQPIDDDRHDLKDVKTITVEVFATVDISYDATETIEE